MPSPRWPEPDEAEDEGGWLGPVPRAAPAPPTAFEIGPTTRRFNEELQAAPGRRGLVVGLLVAVAVLAVASAAVLALNAGRGQTPASPPSDPGTTTFITAQGEGAHATSRSPTTRAHRSGWSGPIRRRGR